jgi:hypothetical protein
MSKQRSRPNSPSSKGVSKDYVDFKTSTGATVRVFQVPEHIIRSVAPKTPKPKRPSVEMQTKTGKQQRWAKSSDPEWEPYQAALDEWEAEKEELQDAVFLVMALRDFQYPDPIEFPPHITDLIDGGYIEEPTDPYQVKATYLRATVVGGQHDELEISMHVRELSGVPEEWVEEMRDSFRRRIFGEESEKLDRGDESTES